MKEAALAEDTLLNRPFQVISTPYMDDLKNALEFDRKCQALEALFNDLQIRIHAVENELSGSEVAIPDPSPCDLPLKKSQRKFIFFVSNLNFQCIT